MICYGGYKLRPQYEYARKLREAQKTGASESVNPASGAAESSATTNAPAEPTGDDPASEPKEAAPAAGPTAKAKLPEVTPEKPAPKKIEPTVTAAAAEYKGRIEKAAAENGLKGRVKVQASNNTLTVGGKLRPGEHREMLQFLRNAPTNVRVVDHIEYDDTPDPAATNDAEGGHPVPTAGHGAIHVMSDVIGATAALHGPAGQVLSQCQTPCSFNNLNPARYGLEVKKDGYESMQTVLQVKSGDALDQKIRLESIAKGLYVSSRPAGADVFINGAKQPGQTPVTLPLAPGQYNLVLRLTGYEAYAGGVQVKDNIQTTLDVELKEKATSRVAWAEVTSNPKGAEIIIDGTSTGQFSPARVQVTAGTHIVTLKLEGYPPVRRTVQVTEGSTVSVEGAFRPK